MWRFWRFSAWRLFHVPLWIANPLMYLGAGLVLAPAVFAVTNGRHWVWYVAAIWYAATIAAIVAMGWTSTVLERTDESVTYRLTRRPSKRLTRRQWVIVVGIFVLPQLVLSAAIPKSWYWLFALAVTSCAWLAYTRLRFRSPKNSPSERPAITPAGADAPLEAPIDDRAAQYDHLLDAAPLSSFPQPQSDERP